MKSCEYAYAHDTQGVSFVVTLSTVPVLSTVIVYSILFYSSTNNCLHFNSLTHLQHISCV